MSAKIDARGLSCPQPVLMTLHAIKTEKADEIEILTDTETSKENVVRSAARQGWSVIDILEEEGNFRVKIRKK
ncbi:MAG: sulfurtransferase TusA family protein [Syntrophales bacterium]|jgi:TusA-related sulfurtransferase|nr:sulfurtransferase TusA family protein [Syntrophales bacterium]MDY0043185.1 sulfurtransferase TusA family protein [Syntrophales bacterium]